MVCDYVTALAKGGQKALNRMSRLFKMFVDKNGKNLDSRINLASLPLIDSVPTVPRLLLNSVA